MIERTLYCDNCGDIIMAGDSVDKVRSDAQEQELYRRVKGVDLCARCHRRYKMGGIIIDTGMKALRPRVR